MKALFDVRLLWLLLIAPISLFLIIIFKQNAMLTPFLWFVFALFSLQTIETLISTITNALQGEKISDIKIGKSEIELGKEV